MRKQKIIPVDIYIVIILVLITSIFVLVPPLNTTIVRAILGIPLVLFFPGYSLIAALFPRKDDIGGIERIALSFGLSVAVVPLLGLGLNSTSWGIRLNSILLTLNIFTLFMCIVAIKRRTSLPDTDVFTVPFKAYYQSVYDEIFLTSRSSVNKILAVVLVISISLSILMVVYVIVNPKQGEKFTEFYILGPDGMIHDYPTEITLGESGTVIVGISNHEYKTVIYSMDLLLDGEQLEMEEYWKVIPLGHNETMERELTFMPHMARTDMKLEFFLYNENNYTEPYKDLRLKISVVEEEK